MNIITILPTFIHINSHLLQSLRQDGKDMIFIVNKVTTNISLNRPALINNIISYSKDIHSQVILQSKALIKKANRLQSLSLINALLQFPREFILIQVANLKSPFLISKSLLSIPLAINIQNIPVNHSQRLQYAGLVQKNQLSKSIFFARYIYSEPAKSVHYTSLKSSHLVSPANSRTHSLIRSKIGRIYLGKKRYLRNVEPSQQLLIQIIIIYMLLNKFLKSPSQSDRIMSQKEKIERVNISLVPQTLHSGLFKFIFSL